MGKLDLNRPGRQPARRHDGMTEFQHERERDRKRDYAIGSDSLEERR